MPNSGTGSGGQAAFTLRGRQGGSGEIVLRYWRHWEGDASIIRRFRLRLNVGP